MSELLIGCGNHRDKRISFEGLPKEWTNLVTLDIDPRSKPDVLHDLNVLPYPFGDSQFSEVHAYEVLEHCGRQGDWRFFFAQFHELWRILKPNGYLIGTVPMWDSPWAWGDPGHSRVITKGSFIFLDQRNYADVGKTMMTDYRQWWTGNFETVAIQENDDQMGFVLKAIK